LTHRGIYITVDLGFAYHVPFLALGDAVPGGAGVRRSASAASARRISSSSRSWPKNGTYRPVIDRTYDLDEIVEATRYVETGQKTGNVVLRVASDA
jgi:NADPH:quinone reductase-like Zn-dependent oxidoreductase